MSYRRRSETDMCFTSKKAVWGHVEHKLNTKIYNYFFENFISDFSINSTVWLYELAGTRPVTDHRGLRKKFTGNIHFIKENITMSRHLAA